MKTKISLDDVIEDDLQIFSAVKVSLHEMGTQNNACPCQTNPHHYLICSLEFNIVIGRMSITMPCIFSDISCVNFGI